MNSKALPTRVGDILKELGFRKDAPESTGHALILNLIRQAYGEAAAQSAARELLMLRNRSTLKTSTEFNESSVISHSSEPVQLSLFDRKLG